MIMNGLSVGGVGAVKNDMMSYDIDLIKSIGNYHSPWRKTEILVYQ